MYGKFGGKREGSKEEKGENKNKQKKDRFIEKLYVTSRVLFSVVITYYSVYSNPNSPTDEALVRLLDCKKGK